MNVSSANGVASVVLMGLPSVTHGIDTTARRLVLPITANAGGTVTVQVPSINSAPAGHYYLIALDGRGVPSAAQIVQVTGGAGATATAAATETAGAAVAKNVPAPRPTRRRRGRLTVRRGPAAVVSERARPQDPSPRRGRRPRRGDGLGGAGRGL
jgi:hypothetical protein